MEERIRNLELGLLEVREKLAAIEARQQEQALGQAETLASLKTQVSTIEGRLDIISDKVSNLTGYLAGAAVIFGLVEPAIVAAVMKFFNL